MKKIILLFFLMVIPFNAFSQNITAYSDAQTLGGGFSYNVTVSITKLETNNTLHAGGWIIKLLAVSPDSKGYYSKGKTNRYYSCSELGSICNPNTFEHVYVNVNYQCKNNGNKSLSFNSINQEIKVVVNQEPNTNCTVQLDHISVQSPLENDKYRKRINELEYPKQTNSGTTNSGTSSKTINSTTEKQTNNSGTQVLINNSSSKKTESAPNNNNPSTPLSESVTVNGESVQVFQQNGKYYMKQADGKTFETTKQAFDGVQNAINSRNNNTSNNNQNKSWTSQQTNDYLKKEEASRQAKYDKIAEQGQVFQNKVEASFQSYYAAKAATEAKSNLKANSTLDGNYNSVAELEADFNVKYRAIAGDANNLREAQNNQLQSNYNYYFNDADANGKALGQAAVGIGALLNEAKADREAKEARERLKQEREAQLAKIKAEQIAQRLALRNKFISQFPDGGIPLSSHKINIDELYYFSYSFDPATISNETPQILLTNVFPIDRYSDQTWPFKNSITKELSKAATNENITLMGYYTSKVLAEQMRNSFITIAGKCEMKTIAFTYKGKQTSKTDSNNDFWVNNKQENNNEKSTKQKEESFDYWGNPIKKSTAETPANTNNNPTQNTTKKEVKLDFWGNPIKE